MNRKPLGVLAGLLFVVVCTGWAVLLFALLGKGLTLPGASAPSDTANSAVSRNEQASGAPKVGALAPDFSLPDLDQQTVQLAQLQGKPVLLNFWATWCAPCSAEMPNFEKVHQQHPGDVHIVAVNQGEKPDQVRGYSEIYRLNFPIVLDEQMQVGDRYRVAALPTTVFIDRHGVVREIHVGGPMSVEFIEGRIRTLLGE